MPVTEISTGKRTQGQFTVEYQQNGYGGCIPIIDGKPEPSLMFGYASETDKRACTKLLEEALRATNGDVYATRLYIMQAVNVAASEIKPDEAVEVEGVEILISYADRKAYLNTEELANLDDMTCDLPDEAIKALLTSRVETVLHRRIEERLAWEEEEDPYDYDDEE